VIMFSDKSCIDLQYGLKSLNYGVNKYFFASHPSERPSVTAEVFDFNCLEPEVPGEKQIPLEITSYIPQHQVHKITRNMEIICLKILLICIRVIHLT